MLSIFWFYFPVSVKLVTAAAEEFFFLLQWGVELAFCTSSLMICDCFSFLYLLALEISLSLSWIMSPGIAASTVSSLNLHLIVKWICISQTFSKSLWLGLRLNHFCTWVCDLLSPQYSVYEPNILTKEQYFLRLTYLSFKSVMCIYWFIFPLIKNKGGRSHTSTSQHKRGSLPWQLSVLCALCCHPPLHLKAVYTCFAGRVLQGGIASPALKGCRGTPTPSTPISYCCWDSLGGGKASSLFFSFV